MNNIILESTFISWTQLSNNKLLSSSEHIHYCCELANSLKDIQQKFYDHNIYLKIYNEQYNKEEQHLFTFKITDNSIEIENKFFYFKETDKIILININIHNEIGSHYRCLDTYIKDKQTQDTYRINDNNRNFLKKTTKDNKEILIIQEINDHQCEKYYFEDENYRYKKQYLETKKVSDKNRIEHIRFNDKTEVEYVYFSDFFIVSIDINKEEISLKESAFVFFNTHFNLENKTVNIKDFFDFLNENKKRIEEYQEMILLAEDKKAIFIEYNLNTILDKIKDKINTSAYFAYEEQLETIRKLDKKTERIVDLEISNPIFKHVKKTTSRSLEINEHYTLQNMKILFDYTKVGYSHKPLQKLYTTNITTPALKG